MVRARVLVADDEPLVRTTITRALADAYDVTAVEDGGQLLELLRADGTFDVILCDLSMPVMGGAFVYFEMVLRAPDLARRFVFLHGGATAPSDRALLAGLEQPQLEKPFSVAQLRAMVQGMLVQN